MSLKNFILLLFCLVAGVCSCKKEPEAERPRICPISIDTIDFTFGIDYDDPSKYLLPGEQSQLSDSNLEEIVSDIGIPDTSIYGILNVCRWVNSNFIFENAGGAMTGVNTVDELFEVKKFYGCHTEALIISSILRKFGFPALLVETASIRWGYSYFNGTASYFKGHVMSEIYLDSTWILLDNDGSYVAEYKYLNPFISTTELNDNLFVIAKGIDTWEYYSRFNAETHELMIEFSDNIYCYKDMFNTFEYTWRN